MSNKMTMADADRAFGSTDSGNHEDHALHNGHGRAPSDLFGDGQHGGGATPTMPHNELDKETLDKDYPPLEIAAEPHLEDLQDDHADGTLQAGLKVAKEIARETQQQGRRRRPLEQATARELPALCLLEGLRADLGVKRSTDDAVQDRQALQ